MKENVVSEDVIIPDQAMELLGKTVEDTKAAASVPEEREKLLEVII